MSNFKCISDGETVVVLYQGANTNGWRAVFTTKTQDDADVWIALQQRRDAQKALYAALVRAENCVSDRETTGQLIDLCDTYVQALLAEQQARMAAGDSSAEVTAA